MKKTISLLLAVIVMLSMMMLTSCSTEKAKVESLLEIDSDFSGHRSITIKYPLSTDIDELKDLALNKNPFASSEKAKFEYKGVEQDGYCFVTDIIFSSHSEYVDIISDIIGREVSVYLSRPDTIFTTGTRMTEDFDVIDIISWIVKLSQDIPDTDNIKYECSVNTVKIDSDVFNTSSTTDISERKGNPINSIKIETTNLKSDTYDRTVTFSIPNSTYDKLANSIKGYFAGNTAPVSQYCGWTSMGNSWEYKVIYQQLSIDELSEYTAMLLDTDSETVFYADKDNSATPLSEGLTFEESFDTFSFINSDGGCVELEYKYALPTKTTHSDGMILDCGKWITKGTWNEGVYDVNIDSDHVNLRIPDGIQYSINGINFDLDVVSNNEFIRTTEFLYSKTQGSDGMNYAYRFFKSKGAEVETDEDADNLVCRVTCSGTAPEITDLLVKCFGSGNYMAYSSKDSIFSLSTKTVMTEYINLGNMLNSTNANRPMKYTVRSDCNVNIVSLMCDGSDMNYTKGDTDTLEIEVSNGVGTVVCDGNIPDTVKIITYSVLGVVLLCGTIAIIVFMLLRRRKKPQPVKSEEIEQTAPTQTTTFSIAELNSLSNITNRKIKNEIDKDVNKKIEADRLENLKKDLKAKEIAELEKKIYGEKNDSDNQ